MVPPSLPEGGRALLDRKGAGDEGDSDSDEYRT